MATTNPKLATATADISLGFGSFANDANALILDDTVASFTTIVKNDNRILELQSFGFDALIPIGAIISQVNLVCRSLRTTGGTTTVYPRISTTDGSANTPANTSLATDTFNAVARPGGGSWTRADLLDGTFFVRFNALQPNNTTSRTYSLAYVTIEVVYILKNPLVLNNYQAATAISAGVISVGERRR